MPTFGERIQKAWNAFRNKDPTPEKPELYTWFGSSSSYRPDRKRFQVGSERSIIAPILNRIAVDASGIDIHHVQLDDQKRYKEDIDDSLNEILVLQANIDQTAREFRQDVFASLLDEGYVAVCPVDADVNPSTWTIDEIYSARVGKILQWYPRHIEVEMYNEVTGHRQTTVLPKSLCAIIRNPFYDIMNAPNSLMVRLRRKLALLDKIDEEVASGKLDMIIQLPYATRTTTNQERAEQRKKDIELQLNGSRYGIAYIDATEKVIQLNRSLDNNLQGQIDSLHKQLHDQLGISPEILNGSATEAQKLNYTKDILEPLISAFTDELKRKWLTRNARTRGQSVMFFINPFRLVPVGDIAELGDKLVRNQILTPNEMRGILGFKPSEQADADMLRNPNMPFDQTGVDVNVDIPTEESTEIPARNEDDQTEGIAENSVENETPPTEFVEDISSV